MAGPDGMAVQAMNVALDDDTEPAKPPTASFIVVALSDATAVQFENVSLPSVQPTKPPK